MAETESVPTAKNKSAIHDVPIVGVLTTSITDSWRGLLWSHPTDEELREAFDQIDTNRNGTLDKTEIADGLRHLGRSERQVQKLIDMMSSQELDFDGFKELVKPAPRPWTTMLGKVPLPNPGKIYDTPVIGNTLHTIGDMCAQPFDNSMRSVWRAQAPTSDERLANTFKHLDTRNAGTLNKKQLAKALRAWGQTEAEIKAALDGINEDEVTLHTFKILVRGKKFQPSKMNYVPIVGPAIANNIIDQCNDDYDEEDLQEVFDFFDPKKTGKLDKSDVADALWELGKSDQQVQGYVDSMEDQEELDFNGFTDLLQPKRRPYLTEVKGVTVPNVGKVHDVPVLGSVTLIAQDMAFEAYDWTAGVLSRRLSRLTDEQLKEKFDEWDTDQSGALSGKEIAKVLRSFGQSERQIKNMRTSTASKNITFEEFKVMCHVPTAAM